MPPNPYLLAADNPAALLALLRDNPSMASAQDEHGYSLVHATASYNHTSALRTLVHDFNVPVDLRDEDGETALFTVETVDAARVLVEELGLDTDLRNEEGQTALEKLAAEGEFPAVVEYLENRSGASTHINGTTNGVAPTDLHVPNGTEITVGTMDEDEAGRETVTELFRGLEELAAREDFWTPEGQAQMRAMVQNAFGDAGLGEQRNVRPREQ